MFIEITHSLPIQQAIGLLGGTGDSWSADNNKRPYLGGTGTFVRVVRIKGKIRWSLKTVMLGFKAIEGKHDGDNLGRYFISMCIRIGIIDPVKKTSKVSSQE